MTDDLEGSEYCDIWVRLLNARRVIDSTHSNLIKDNLDTFLDHLDDCADCNEISATIDESVILNTVHDLLIDLGIDGEYI